MYKDLFIHSKLASLIGQLYLQKIDPSPCPGNAIQKILAIDKRSRRCTKMYKNHRSIVLKKIKDRLAPSHTTYHKDFQDIFCTCSIHLTTMPARSSSKLDDWLANYAIDNDFHHHPICCYMPCCHAAALLRPPSVNHAITTPSDVDKDIVISSIRIDLMVMKIKRCDQTGR